MPGFRLDIERQPKLIGIDVKKDPTTLQMWFVVRERAHAPGDVSHIGVLDFDNLRAEVGEELSSVGPCDALGQVDHSNTGEQAPIVHAGASS